MTLPFILATTLLAGPYAPPAGQAGSDAVPMDSAEIRSWASSIFRYEPGEAVDTAWQTPEKALGPAVGSAYDVVSLGRGGSIVVELPDGISNGPGWDFVVFENGFDDYFLELAAVGVSSDNIQWTAFLPYSETSMAVAAYGQVDATNINGLAGKYRAGYGTPFDLSDLEIPEGQSVDLAYIRSIILSDIKGDGSIPDALGRPIYDPYPTTGSAGFDLDAIGVRYPRAFDSIKLENSDWSYSATFGFYVGVGFPWIYSQEQGAWYVSGNETEGLWIWDSQLGWLWTVNSLYPTLFSVDQGWLYFGGSNEGTRYFNVLSSGEWFAVPMN